jgi:hypothetical protein
MNVADRYARAITSSHLEVTEFTGDIDALVASGWCKESLATMLWRLRVEFDSVDAREVVPLPEMAPPDRLFARGLEAELATWRKGELARIAKDLADRRTMATALALVHMKSLHAAKEALGRFVMAMATREHLELDVNEQLRLSGRVLVSFLNSLCPTCHGVKFKTVPGSGRLSAMPCESCEGSGRDKIRFTGNTDPTEVMFTQAVLAELDRKMQHVAGLMKRFLREREVVA